MDLNDSPGWTEEERSIRTSRASRREQAEATFSEAFLSRLRSSIFGTYLDVFNYQQDQSGGLLENKSLLTRKFVEGLRGEDVRRFARRNDIGEDLVEIWDGFARTGRRFTLEGLVGVLAELRLVDCHIGQMDCDLRNFSKLQVLVLSSNNLTSIDSKALPRGLKYLELYNNFIADLGEFVNGPPEYLFYLGLGRNCITENSQLHLFASTGNLQNLLYLDLSENDIVDLERILEQIEGLGLGSLRLHGNPCYLNPYYLSAVSQHLPDLFYLDDIEAPESALDEPLDIEQPEIVFYCFALKGLRLSAKDNHKKGRRTVHVQVSIPLLERGQGETGESGSQGEGKGFLEYDTEKMSYKETMRFPPTYIRHEDLVLLRDAFWTTVTVKIVLTTFPVKKKPPVQSKNHQRSSSGLIEEEVDQTILYSFRCDLRCPAWNEPHLEFYWENDVNKYGDKAVEKFEIENEEAKINRKKQKSNTVHCHIGFGLKRCD